MKDEKTLLCVYRERRERGMQDDDDVRTVFSTEIYSLI